MDILKNLYVHKWKALLFLYVILILSSSIYITRNGNVVSIEQVQALDQSKPTLLLFENPLESNLELLDSLFNIVQIDGFESGLGFSFHEISNFAITTLDSLEIEKVYVFGSGISGLSAIHFSSINTHRVQGLLLLSSKGVVELELLGGYHLNKAVYKTKLGFLLFIKYIIPHFGKFDGLDENIFMSRIQLSSDQRQIRSLVQKVNVPTLIMHSNEGSESLRASEELARLIPKSERIDIGREQLSRKVNEFMNKGVSSISALREIQSLLPFDETNTIKAEGKALIVLILVIIFSTLVSEDLTCIGTGLLIARGLIGFFPGVLACLFGIFVGDILLYVSGRWLASSTLHKAPLKWFITEKDVQKSYYWFEAKGPSIIIASRFIPGTRFPTYFSAGAIGANFWVFIFYFGIASIIWTPILVGLAKLLGQEMLDYFYIYQEYAIWVILGVLFGGYFLFKLVVPMFTYRGRRLLVGKLKRLINWEFWPTYVIYFPVFFYLFFLWIKFKSVTLFALANPAIPEGGFIKESKKEILDGIKQKESVALYSKVNGSLTKAGKLNHIKSFQANHDLGFPIVLKPDIGERGKGVLLPKSEEELEMLIEEVQTDHICQEFIDGQEFGVFYYRYPNEDKGHIFSITKKIYLELIGDGIHSLEELILRDSRAICLAELHFDKHFDHLFDIPKQGEIIKLVELGTHSRGAIFLDANHLITDKLSFEIDKISSSYKGFYFGRYDVKVPSEQALNEGKMIKVIELNGVTSESTNIYDSNHSFFYAVRILAKQWGIAYEIGKQNKALNSTSKEPTLKHLLSLLR